MAHRCMLVILVLLANVSLLLADQLLEAEKLQLVTPTPGQIERQNLVDIGLAERGQFGADSILLWYDAQKGDVLELKVPVQETARYSITVQLAKSWDYGIHQFVVNGVDSGNPVDLYAAESPGAAGPLQRKLPEVNLPAGETILGLRVVGANPEASRNRFAAGIDWIKLEKVGEISGGGETNPPLIVVPENREDFAGAWLDRERYWLTLVSVDGTWGMMPEADGTTPRAGNWGMPERLHVTFRTCLGRESELWIGGLKARSAHDLLHGPYDLTMVWDLQWQDGLLVGTLRTWQARYSASGEIAEFKSWDDPGNDPLPVTWRPVPQPTPGQDLPRPMPSILRRLPERPDPGVMRNFLDWYLGR